MKRNQDPSQKSDQTPGRQKWQKGWVRKTEGPRLVKQTHIPFGIGKHRKSFGHV